MCGIVAYFGDGGNRLARVISGMWAIVYRAPDSTGIGLIGSDLEPVKIRRELGSVNNLTNKLMKSPVFDETELRVVSIQDEGVNSYGELVVQNQKKLLAFEGFSPEEPFKIRREGSRFLTWSVMTDPQRILEVEPGTPGEPDIRERFEIDSPTAFKRTINRLVMDFDLPLVVVEKLIQTGLEHEVQNRWKAMPPPVEQEHIFHEFKQLFYGYAHGEAPEQPSQATYIPGRKTPYTRKYLWQYLKDLTVILPPDHTLDGIANLFRTIDSSIMAGIVHSPEMDDKIQRIFENFRSMNSIMPEIHWRSLYRTERLYNVYGIAAASALAYFQTEIYMKTMLESKEGKELPPGHIPGRTHPLLLKYMVQPVIAQGRWALQSSISVNNAHPFLDEKKLRAIVLNGQFNSDIESRVNRYLTRVAGINLRSENSTELFALLWGHYFDTAHTTNQRYKEIEKQHQLGLEDISVCSQSVDYGIFKALGSKTTADMDEMAFIQAMEAMIKAGGQFAVSGISLVSQDRLFVGVHKRPVYIVKRLDTSDFMVVSDINAAIGLFPQTLNQSISIKLRKLMNEYSKKSVIVEPHFFKDTPDDEDSWFRQKKMSLLAPFQVEIYALDQERLFAKIQTEAGVDTVLRKLTLRDFSGKIRTDIRPERTHLTPITFKKDFGRTFYEEHLYEIPGLLKELLDRYTASEKRVPLFDIRKRLLERRFGSGLAALNRIILVSTGFSYFLAQIVEKTMEPFFSGVTIQVTSPLGMNRVESAISPDRDLVVMISWSGTTSDMIDCASHFMNRNILMIGVTEKPFSDLGLIVRKSVGVIPVFSGEEATVAALKSAVSMLMVLDLLCLYLLVMNGGSTKKSAVLVKKMAQLPEKIHTVLTDESVVDFCRDIAQTTQRTPFHFIIDDLHNTGSARPGVFNLELNAWTSMGSALDYSELDSFMSMIPAESPLVMVNATNSERLLQGIHCMAALAEKEKPFYAVSYQNREKQKIIQYAEKALFLPKVPDYFQPFIDLPFMFLFGFYFGLARGRLSDQMPRNLAKSVTAGRLTTSSGQPVSDILDRITLKNQSLQESFSALSGRTRTPCWITQAAHASEQRYYTDLIQLCSAFHEPDPFSAMFTTPPDKSLEAVSTLIFDYLTEDGSILFVPMDKPAESGCHNFIRLWEPFLHLPLQVKYPEKIRQGKTEDTLMILMASKAVDKKLISFMSRYSHENLLWIGQGTPAMVRKTFPKAFKSYHFRYPDLACPFDHSYVALSLFFSTVMAHKYPERAELFMDHFKLFLPTVNSILTDKDFRQVIRKTVKENHAYKKRLFITGSKGNCLPWKYQFCTNNNRWLESDTFGVSAYSHLVMIDPLVKDKFVRLKSRYELEKTYPESDILEWENRYLGGSRMDHFIETGSMPVQTESVLPFVVDDQWYLPVLKPDYDTDRDCLVIIDATSKTQFDAALDELSTFGSRYARLVVITQKGLFEDLKLANLTKYPLSHIIYLPGIADRDGHAVVISDYMLPMVMNIIGSAMKFLDLE